MSLAVVVRDPRKAFGDHVVLDSIEILEVRRDWVIAMLGPRRQRDQQDDDDAEVRRGLHLIARESHGGHRWASEPPSRTLWCATPIRVPDRKCAGVSRPAAFLRALGIDFPEAIAKAENRPSRASGVAFLGLAGWLAAERRA